MSPAVPAGWPLGGRADRRQLRAPCQSAQHLGLLHRCGLPLPAGLAAGEMLVDPGGGNGLALTVDTGGQSLPRDVAIHASIVAYPAGFVPPISALYFGGIRMPPSTRTTSAFM
jgi:hypothetical protein